VLGAGVVEVGVEVVELAGDAADRPVLVGARPRCEVFPPGVEGVELGEGGGEVGGDVGWFERPELLKLGDEAAADRCPVDRGGLHAGVVADAGGG
jgi:hypothetical protein